VKASISATALRSYGRSFCSPFFSFFFSFSIFEQSATHGLQAQRTREIELQTLAKRDLNSHGAHAFIQNTIGCRIHLGGKAEAARCAGSRPFRSPSTALLREYQEGFLAWTWRFQARPPDNRP